MAAVQTNRWKVAFWILIAVWLTTTAVLLYEILDQAVTLTYMQEGYRDCEEDLKILTRSIPGKLERGDFKANDTDTLCKEGYLHFHTFRVSFGGDGKVDSVLTDW
jgi:hypothetical protein